MNNKYTEKMDSVMLKNIISNTICELIKNNNKIVWLDADLMGCSGTNKYYKENPNFINVGIAEANMIGIAAGLSSVGMIPYCHSFGPFASRRCFDQVFLSAGYAGNPITVIGSDPGITASFNGGTHMPFEDIALYRVIPNSIIVDVTDATMLASILRMAEKLPGVKYIRTPRKPAYIIYSPNEKFEIGHGKVLREGNDGVIIASGIMVHEALKAAETLKTMDINATVIDPFTIKPLDVELIKKYAVKTGNVVVAENHNRIGGLTSAVSEALIGTPCKFHYVAVEDEFGEVGPQEYLRERFDLTDKHIVKAFTL